MEVSHFIYKYRNLFTENRKLYLARVPLRISPLGAHIDHQLGIVCGMTVNRYIYLIFGENEEGKIRIYSENFKDKVEFNISDKLQKENKWSDYIKGAVYVLLEKYGIKKGIDGIIYSEISVRGLSSSAAVGVSYLIALKTVNGIDLSEKEDIFLVQKIENNFIGLNNGILDQSVILLNSSEPSSLLFLDCKNYEYKNVVPDEKVDFSIIIVNSGIDRVLVSTVYNERVRECIRAGKLLLKLAGLKVPEDVRLRDVNREYFEKYKEKLPENLRRRAEHFYSEMERIEKGIGLWKKGEMEKFGELIKNSGYSSIKNYECGIPETIYLYEILNSHKDIYGARFSGAGFGGSCIGLIKSDCKKEKLKEEIEKKYIKKFPSLKNKFNVFFAKHGEKPVIIPL